MGRRSRITFLVLATLTAPAVAEDASTDVPSKERKTLESFGTANPACREWSDGCAVCARPDDKTFNCSLPGIACQPTAVVCREPKPADPSKP